MGDVGGENNSSCAVSNSMSSTGGMSRGTLMSSVVSISLAISFSDDLFSPSDDLIAPSEVDFLVLTFSTFLVLGLSSFGWYVTSTFFL